MCSVCVSFVPLCYCSYFGRSPTRTVLVFYSDCYSNAALTGAKKRDEGVSLVSRPVVFIVLLASMTLGGAVLFSLTKKRREQTDEEESHVCSKLGPKIAPSYGATL